MPDSRVKLLHVFEVLQGGQGTYLSLFAEDELSWIDSYVIAPDRHASSVPKSLPSVFYRAPRRSLRSLARLAWTTLVTARRIKPDVIFLHSSFSLPLAPIVWAWSSARIIYCPHGWAAYRYKSGSLKHRLCAFVEGCLAWFPHRVLNISRFDQMASAKAGYLGSHEILLNAVRDSSLTQQEVRSAGDDSGISLLFVGRFDRQKGVDLLLDQFSRASQARPDLRLFLIGQPVLSTERCFPVDLPGVTAVGWVDNSEIDRWFAEADALVIPSRWEGFGLVVAEAYRNGCPVIASDVGALPDLVEHGRTGFIFSHERGDLADLLASLSCEQLHAMRRRCRAIYDERFSIVRYSRDFHRLLESLDVQRPANTAETRRS
ncbi:glycosyltransferase family 4 protein [Silicimonas sp. MF1-12-2]|uniref:glycosyltransferase family 4 protein n=1 Tax=Silicimonas sp. MF1-12-2 TaxID=3384793 RepID=UPI0039B59649